MEDLTKDPSNEREPRPDRSLLVAIGVLGTLGVLSLLTALSRALEPNQSVVQRLSAFVLCAVYVICLVALVVVWRIGGFEKLRRTGVWGFFQQLLEVLALIVHRGGGAVAAMGVAAGVLVVLSTLADEPMPGIKGVAWFAVGAVALGALVQGFTRRREITVRGRVTRQCCSCGQGLRRPGLAGRRSVPGWRDAHQRVAQEAPGLAPHSGSPGEASKPCARGDRVPSHRAGRAALVQRQVIQVRT